jgi:hypothetical protein
MEHHRWEPQHELILKRWAEIASCYSWMHDRAYREYKVKNMYYAIPVIILSTLTGTANFAQQSIPEKHRPIAIMVIGSLNLLSGLITTLAQFFKVNELQEAHRSSNMLFSKFSRNISVELNLPITDRSHDGVTFLENCRQEYNRLIEQSPSIPTTVLSTFNYKFKKSHITKPTISKLAEVEIYHDHEYQAQKEMKQRKKEEEEEETERLAEHRKTMANLENIKQQISFKIPNPMKSHLDSTSLSGEETEYISDNDSNNNNDIISSVNQIEKNKQDNIEMVASEITNEVITNAKNKINEINEIDENNDTNIV